MLQLHVENMTCGGCVKSVTRAVESVAKDAKVNVDLPTGTVWVTGTGNEAGVLAALARAGFQANMRDADRR